MKKESPSVDQWLREAKADPAAKDCGMFLVHNGTVRRTAKAKVRQGREDTEAVTGMIFRYDADRVEQAVQAAKRMEGIFYVRVWLNEGELSLGDDITEEQVDSLIKSVKEVVEYLRGMSPIWRDLCEGRKQFILK